MEYQLTWLKNNWRKNLKEESKKLLKKIKKKKVIENWKLSKPTDRLSSRNLKQNGSKGRKNVIKKIKILSVKDEPPYNDYSFILHFIYYPFSYSLYQFRLRKNSFAKWL